jgi:hypothetical protein
MALVVVGSTFDLSGQHGEDRLTPAQGLDLALLIHAQHDGVMRRVHVQADYIAHLVDQQRIVGQLEGLAAMGTQSERPPDPADRGLTQSGSGGQGATAPMSSSPGSFLQCETYGTFHLIVADLAWRSRAHLIA